MDEDARIESSTLVDESQGDTIAPAAEDRGHVLSPIEAMRIIFVALASAAVWFHVWEPLTSVSLIGVLGVLIGGWPIFKEAAENVAARRRAMELAMRIAIVSASWLDQYL